MGRIKVGISIGDINGIGLEVIIKALNDKRVLKYGTPIIYGSSKVFSYHANIMEDLSVPVQHIRELSEVSDDKINVMNCWTDLADIKLGQQTEEAGKYASISLEKCTTDAISGHIDAMVTAPIHKKVMSLSGFRYIGHTDYLRDQCASNDVLMMLCSKDMRMALGTGHIPIQDVPVSLSVDKIMGKLQVLLETLKMDFDISKPKIAVLGMQPHAGDLGMIGQEDENLTKPAIAKMKSKGHLVFGPYPADGFFGQMLHTNFDAVFSCYHDQGLVPFKMASFGSGVNMSCGLPIIRTSPDHGTAFDIAGKNIADPSSFRTAFFMAVDASRMRKTYIEMHNAPIKKKYQIDHTDEDVVHD